MHKPHLEAVDRSHDAGVLLGGVAGLLLADVGPVLLAVQAAVLHAPRKQHTIRSFQLYSMYVAKKRM